MTLLTGDVILVTGTTIFSRSLVAIQKSIIPEAVSSHIMVANAETLVIDALKEKGVNHRFILDAFEDIEPSWKVMRSVGLNQDHKDKIIKASTYYLCQSYKIHASKIKGDYESYCSELARKIFERANIDTDIPDSTMVMPAHFDLLFMNSEKWEDVTNEVHEFLKEVKDNEAEYRARTQLMISGINRNRKRFDERKQWKQSLKDLYRNRRITKEKYEEALSIIEGIESQMSYNFWDK